MINKKLHCDEPISIPLEAMVCKYVFSNRQQSVGKGWIRSTTSNKYYRRHVRSDPAHTNNMNNIIIMETVPAKYTMIFQIPFQKHGWT